MKIKKMGEIEMDVEKPNCSTLFVMTQSLPTNGAGLHGQSLLQRHQLPPTLHSNALQTPKNVIVQVRGRQTKLEVEESSSQPLYFLAFLPTSRRCVDSKLALPSAKLIRLSSAWACGFWKRRKKWIT